MYHPHAEEMVPMTMGVMGFWVSHRRIKNGRKHPLIDEADRAFCFWLNSCDIDPGSYTPMIRTLLNFPSPSDTAAYKFTGTLPDPARFKAEGGVSMPPLQPLKAPIEVKSRKPGAGDGEHHCPSAFPTSLSFTPYVPI